MLESHKLAYIQQFHPSFRASFFVATKVLLYTTDAGIEHTAFMPPVRYSRRFSTDLEEATHFTANRYDWRARSHAVANLRRVRTLTVDIDCGEDRRVKGECLDHLFNHFSDELFPSHIVETRRGYHVTFTLRFPCGSDRFDMATSALERLIEVMDGDRNQPRLNILTALPATPTRLVFSDPGNKITCSDVFRACKSKSVARRGPRSDDQGAPLITGTTQKQIVTETVQAFAEGVRNNSIYTLLLLARDRGISPAQAITDIEHHYCIDAGSIDGLSETTRSAYSGRRHATNARIQTYCLGHSVGDVSRRLGWSRGYARTMKDEDLDTLRRRNLQGENTRRQQRAFEAIREAVANLMEEGRPVTATAIHRLSGVHQKTINKYRGLAWFTD